MEARFDEDGALILNHKRYRDFFNRRQSVSKSQHDDEMLIKWIGRLDIALYESEYRDYIEDYQTNKTLQIFWDHVIVTKRNNIVLFESDDPSHSDYNFSLQKGYVKNQEEFQAHQYRDEIKDIWARRNNIPLIRLSYTLTLQQKIDLIHNALTNN